ncbi:hypothetical protein D0Z07_6647 [Hyphodiscus hymeniophilus]|uniref:Uncharacterized protein n=1 Tax=Hyphodiscus hymeniophilus TaxID=353542 RepID=A0A9P6VHC5_9HELO|nr:hypothetical protein D0Z07_6647 [Hyphodiscus hymeniophilus]
MASTSSPAPVPAAKVDHGPWYFDSTFWKRFSVVLSIVLSIASLILSAIASLKKESADMLKALTVAGIRLDCIVRAHESGLAEFGKEE